MANCGEMWYSSFTVRVLQWDECPGDGKTIPSLQLPMVCSFTTIILGVTINVTLGLPYSERTADPGLNETAARKACTILASEPDSLQQRKTLEIPLLFCVHMRKLIIST